MNFIKSLIRQLSKTRPAFAAGLFAFVLLTAGTAVTQSRTAFAACDNVNIIRCGLDGGGLAAYIGSMKAHWNNNNPADFRAIAQWGGWTQGLVDGMNGENTQMGTLNANTGAITVGGRVVATNTHMSARFNGGAGFYPIKAGVWARPITVSHDRASYPVMMRFNSAGAVVAGIVPDCGNVIKVNPTPPPPPPAPQPTLACVRLTREGMQDGDPSTFKFTANAKADNNTITSYVFHFGDGDNNRSTVNTSADTASVKHKYANPGDYTARVFVHSTKIDSTPATDACTVTVNVPKPNEPTPGVKIEKSVSKSSLVPGEIFTYTLKVTNNGKLNLKNVAVRDPAPAGVAFINPTHGRFENGSWLYTIPSLGVGQTFTMSTTAKVTQEVAGQIVNTACVNAPEVNPGQPNKDDGCADVAINITTTPPPPPPAPTHPGVEISKNISKSAVKVNEVFTYTLNVKNTGDVALTNVAVRDPAPAGVAFINPTHGRFENGSWLYTIPSLGVGQTFTMSTTAKVTQEVAGQIVNTACVNAPEVNPGNPSANDDCDDVPVTLVKENPSVLIKKTVSKNNLVVGEEFEYKISVTNNGSVVLTHVKVSDKQPDGIDFLSASAGTVSDDGWTHELATLAVGQTVEFTIKAKVVGYKEGETVNKVCVNADEVNPNEPNKEDACDEVPVEMEKKKNPAVSIDKKVSKETVKVGEEFVYTIRVTNTGDTDLKDVLVSDTAPDNVTFVSADEGEVDGDKWKATLTNLSPTQSVEFKITAKVTKYVEGDIVNTACVNAKEVNPKEPNKNDDCDDAKNKTEKPDAPVFTCDLLTLTTQSGRIVNTKVDYTAAGGATYKAVSIDFGEGEGSVVNTEDTEVAYQYEADGEYTVKANVKFMVNNEEKLSADNANCVKKVKFTAPTTPGQILGENDQIVEVTPLSAAEQLPDTGPGEMVAISTVIGAAGIAWHRLIWRRLFLV